MTELAQRFNLAGMIAADLTRHSLRVLLFLLVMISAVAVILSTHHNRQMSIAHEKLMQEKDQLDVEWRHLILEQSALTEHNRIESLVKEQLKMHRPSADEEVAVKVK